MWLLQNAVANSACLQHCIAFKEKRQLTLSCNAISDSKRKNASRNNLQNLLVSFDFFFKKCESILNVRKISLVTLLEFV
jgi:hypothetical protein